jgi:hypothetical protein
VLIDAKHAAESVTSEYSKVFALAAVARVLAATDPDRAAQVIADAERIARSITDGFWKVEALVVIVEV